MRQSPFRPDFICTIRAARVSLLVLLFGQGAWLNRGFALEGATAGEVTKAVSAVNAVDTLGLIELAAKGDTFEPEFVQTLSATPLDALNTARDEDGRTMVHWLAARSHQARLLALLLHGGDVHGKDHRGRTPLFDNLEASDPYFKGSGDFMVLEMLVACGADFNLRATDGTTPLAIAVERGDYRKVEFLLWCGAELNPVGVPPAKLPVQIARAKGDQRMIAILDATAKQDSGMSGASTSRFLKGHRNLSEILTAADLNAVEGMIAAGWKINEQDEKGRTALLRAVEAGRADLANLLILEGADPNIAAKTGKTPLMASMRLLTIEGQRMNGMLLLRGADTGAATQEGVTPLIAAVSAGNDFGVLWLLAQGADPFVETPKGSLMAYADHPPTARLLRAFGLSTVAKVAPLDPVAILIEAVKINDIEGVERSLDSGVLPDATDKYHRTALDWAVSYGEFEIVDLLLKRGANINRQSSKTGYHFLHHLATWGTAAGGGDGAVAGDYIEKLVLRGASVDVAKKDGMTPLMIAAKEGATGANTEALLRAGARLTARNKDGLTPLGVARKFGRTEMVEFLKARGAQE